MRGYSPKFKFKPYDYDEDEVGDYCHTHVIAQNIVDAKKQLAEVTGASEHWFEDVILYLEEVPTSKETLRRLLKKDMQEVGGKQII